MIIQKDKTKNELAEYLHKVAFSPAISTFQRAIQNGNFVTWLGINEINFTIYVTNQIPTAKGHLDQKRANSQSTKPKDSDLEDFQPTDRCAKKTWENSSFLYAFEPKQITYLDQTGCFPHQLSRGNEYIMVMYDYDADTILVAALKNRQAKTIAVAWESLHRRLT